jgi:hypothetical protein
LTVGPGAVVGVRTAAGGRVGAGIGQVVADRDRGVVVALRALFLLLDGLRAAHHLAVRIEGLLGRRDLVEVQVGADFGLDPSGSERTLEQLFDGLLQARLVGLAELLRLGGQGALRGTVAAAREQRSLVIDHGDPLGQQVGHGGRDQVLDRQHLAPVEPAPAVHEERDRGAGLDPVPTEQLVLGQDEMDPR